ncbi:MAG: aldehyde dehydrogenase family protein, partial [Candidatus Binatia bacterium]
MTITNPATGEAIAQVDEDTPDGIAAKAARARAAQPAWAATPLAERAAALRRFGELLARDGQE